MTENVRLELGLVTVEAVPAKAFAGHRGRVYATEREAISDKASNELADIWLGHGMTGWPSFSVIMQYVESNPDLFEAAIKLARFRNVS